MARFGRLSDTLKVACRNKPWPENAAATVINTWAGLFWPRPSLTEAVAILPCWEAPPVSGWVNLSQRGGGRLSVREHNQVSKTSSRPIPAHQSCIWLEAFTTKSWFGNTASQFSAALCTIARAQTRLWPVTERTVFCWDVAFADDWGLKIENHSLRLNLRTPTECETDKMY